MLIEDSLLVSVEAEISEKIDLRQEEVAGMVNRMGDSLISILNRSKEGGRLRF